MIVLGFLLGFRSLLRSSAVVLRPYPDRWSRFVGLEMDAVAFHFGKRGGASTCWFFVVRGFAVDGGGP